MKHDTKHEKNIFLSIYRNGVKFSQGLNDCAAVGETENFMEKEMVLDCFAFCICLMHLVWCRDSLHVMLKFDACLIKVEDLLS